VVPIIDTKESTRAGYRMAMVWAIIEPIDSPTASAAISASVYVGRVSLNAVCNALAGDNGPELACAAMSEWAHDNVGLHFIPLG
jgi:hypothetical protein